MSGGDHSWVSPVEVAETIVLLLGIGVALAWVSSKTGVPYPVVLVGAGTLIAFVPGVPAVELDPQLVLLLFVAPLLYADAFFAPYSELRRNAGSIARLASLLVLVTAGLVGVAAHYLIGLEWAVAFALGAALAATDALAPAQILGKEGVDPRLVAIVQGESIFNDGVAFALVGVASTAAVSGSFAISTALGTLALSVIGGIAIGLALAWLVAKARRHTDDVMVEAGLSLITPFAVYMAAHAIGASGILAAVAAGLYLGRRSHDLVEPLTRVELQSAWGIITFVLNTLLFLLVGLQARDIVAAVDMPFWKVAGAGLAIAAVVIGVRLLWALFLPTAWHAGRRSAPSSSKGWRFALAWSGPRGAVALAAALSLPKTVDGGAPMPGRDLVIVLTLTVIVATLVGQGLTLRPLVRRLGLTDRRAEQREEDRAKRVAAEAALERLPESAERHDVDDEGREWLGREYAMRAERFGDGSEARKRSLKGEEKTDLELLEAARNAVLELEARGEIRSDVAREVLRELDLDSARLRG
jgi:CPA1 family monovalent cation:H+ antiporter